MHDSNLEKISKFIKQHHLLTLATSQNNIPYVNSAFYAFNDDNMTFIIASDDKTQHIKNVSHNSNVAVSIALETKEVGKIQGIQINAIMSESYTLKGHQDYDSNAKLYFKEFPYAKIMNPKLWILKIEWMKFTDNRLGFGNKIEINFKES
jgi:uncharacterized protein